MRRLKCLMYHKCHRHTQSFKHFFQIRHNFFLDFLKLNAVHRIDLADDKFNIAGLLMAAIISDTLMFRSPTCTPVDQKAAEDLSEICGVEIEEFAVDMFGAGSDQSSKEPKEIFNQDLKRFEVGDIEFFVSQINSMNRLSIWKRLHRRSAMI